MRDEPDVLLRIQGVSKAYPGVLANDGISFGILPGEVHALPGENGAGKSTLRNGGTAGACRRPDMAVTENALLTCAAREDLAQSGFISWVMARHFAERIIADFDAHTPGTEFAARALSGGNLRKL